MSSLSQHPQQQQQQQHLMQNMESLLESMNTGNLQNVDLAQFQMLMDSMKAVDFHTAGMDPNQWHELAFSFSQYLQQQGMLQGSTGPPSLHTSLTSTSSLGSANSPPNSAQQLAGPSSLHNSQQSYHSSASFSGGSVHSIPGITVTHVKSDAAPPTMPPSILDDDVDDFDWDSIM